MEEAEKDYLVVGVTLESMLQVTGIGVDFESFAKKMPQALQLRLLILHPDSPYFRERVLAAHPLASDPEAVVKTKKEAIERVLATVKQVCKSDNVRFYDSFPAWWIQYVDKERIYVATQTRGGYIGQTYPFAMLLKRSDFSDLFWTFETYVESLWQHSILATPDWRVPPPTCPGATTNRG